MTGSVDLSKKSDSKTAEVSNTTSAMNKDFLQTSLPKSDDLAFLSQWFPSDSQRVKAFELLLDPVREFLGRSAKHVRGQLVFSSFELVKGTEKKSADQHSLLKVLATLVESLHAGSSVIDDIQDSSETRRGEPALHSTIGEASAINAANWLYFWPTGLIRKQGLAPALELEIYRLYHHTLTRAHYGQALDLSFDMTKTSRETAHAISMAAITLKTGTLMSMCAEFGALAAGANNEAREKLANFGQSFGVFLQMYNDLSEFRMSDSVKERKEPFIRPSWVWAIAAQMLEDQEFTEFQELMSESTEIASFTHLSTHPVIANAWTQAREAINLSLEDLKKDFHNDPAIASIEELIRRIIAAYG